MSEETVVRRRREKHPGGQPRRIPTQQRGRERFEKILAVAAELIEKHGSDALKMSEIVEKAELSFGAVYQYFPDKSSIVRTLAERFNEEGRLCVEAAFSHVTDPASLQTALVVIADEYYRFFRREPVMRDIWHATQADKLLREVDAEDMEFHSRALLAVVQQLWPDRAESDLLPASRLLMQLLAAAVRYAISLNDAEGDAAIGLYKSMLPADIEKLFPS